MRTFPLDPYKMHLLLSFPYVSSLKSMGFFTHHLSTISSMSWKDSESSSLSLLSLLSFARLREKYLEDN